MTEKDVTVEMSRLWTKLFIRDWYLVGGSIQNEIILCEAAARTGEERAQKYWNEFIAARLKG